MFFLENISLLVIAGVLLIFYFSAWYVNKGAFKVYRVVTRHTGDGDPFWIIEAKNVFFPFWYTFGDLSDFCIRSFSSQQSCIDKLKRHLEYLEQHELDMNTLKMKRKQTEQKYLGSADTLLGKYTYPIAPK